MNRDIPKVTNPVEHPEYYSQLIPEPIDLIESWGLDFHLGQVIKYISRAGFKNPNKEIEDLEKAEFYLSRKIDLLKTQQKMCLSKAQEKDNEEYLNLTIS